MSIITFWSNDNIETGQTMSMAAIATYLSIEHNYKILLINTAKNDYTLEDGFWPQNKKKIIKIKQDIDTGTKGLLRIMTSNKILPEIVKNYTKTIFKNRLELLTDNDLPDSDYLKQQELMPDIVKLANKYYDYVFVDLKGNIEDENIKRVLENSNLIVSNITQRLRNINDYMQLKEREELLRKENVIILIGNYNPRSAKYTNRNIARYMREKNIYYIPFSNLFFEVANEGLVADYFIKFRKIKNTNPNAPFIEAIEQSAEAITTKVKELQMKIY